MHIELAALQQRNVHRMKEIEALQVRNHRHFLALRRHIAGNAELPSISRAHITHGQVRSESGANDAGGVAEPIKERRLQSEAAFGFVSRA